MSCPWVAVSLFGLFICSSSCKFEWQHKREKNHSCWVWYGSKNFSKVRKSELLSYYNSSWNDPVKSQPGHCNDGWLVGFMASQPLLIIQRQIHFYTSSQFLFKQLGLALARNLNVSTVLSRLAYERKQIGLHLRPRKITSGYGRKWWSPFLTLTGSYC